MNRHKGSGKSDKRGDGLSGGVEVFFENGEGGTWEEAVSSAQGKTEEDCRQGPSANLASKGFQNSALSNANP
jgi:hypothetical protein